ncbi:multidrug transporter AcrB [Vandammella animalimorsus]|uniref:Multidrug transporter AcrB n=1 Tax=Vandammella animalimorsus TaxID=2029117 RepID=A0A2A2T8Z3_9BURK|nr:efflux RND transporter permease subunit [Vandammella animalimorsus]PAT30750.1 multidrug transporter AcrB [Vandammella animalimorsus]PAX18553.1 multidrug transporter AcrB [Vandammella animalimorsus]PAX20715.1 multidrug transporter AcrB [Vandammella animalimorsus]
MGLSELSVRRPVLATVMSLLLVLVGLVCFFTLTVREYPRIDEPVVTVRASYSGASAAVVESRLAKPLEDSIAGIEGVDVISSISRAGQAQITVRFVLEKDPDNAAAEVRDRVARVRARLPAEIDEPVVAKVEADATPVIWLAFSSAQRSPLEINELMLRIARPLLQTVPGVADTPIFGERRYAMRVALQPERMAAHGLTVEEIESAIRASNLELPAGRIESHERELNVVSHTELATPSQFADIVLRHGAGLKLRLGDVAQVEEGPASLRSRVRFNGQEAVSMGIVRQATANPLEVAAGIRQALQRLRAELPGDVQVTIANDNAVFIERSIASVYATIAEAVLLVVLVIVVFLGSLRAALVPIVTIPISLIGTFALMALAGFSINTLTLLAMVLAIGLVVDDAIVMLENIHRHIEAGQRPFEAAIAGAREIGFAIVAMTLTLAAVYAPLAFTPGRTGRLFAEFALTLAGTVLVSGFVALTLSPMLCALLLRPHAQAGRWAQAVQRALRGLERGYASVLGWTVRTRAEAAGQAPAAAKETALAPPPASSTLLAAAAQRPVWAGRMAVLLAMLGCGLALAWLYPRLPAELAPMEDRGTLQVRMSAPDGASLDYTDRYVREAEELVRRHPEFDRVFASVGNPTVQNGTLIVRTVDWSERERGIEALAAQVGQDMREVPGVFSFLNTPPPLGMGFSSRPLQYVIQTTGSYEQLHEIVQQFMQAMREHPAIDSPDVDLRLSAPQLRIEVDRERAADLGVQPATVARTLESLLGGRIVTRYKKGAEQYDVWVQLAAPARATPEQIGRIQVRSAQGALVPLSALLRIDEGTAPRELNHFGQRRSATLTARIAPGHTLGQALDFMDELAERTLPAGQGYATALSGASREYRSAQGALTLVFALALLFIYLVLAAQFESFVDPLVIMVSVPLSMVGALLALWLSGGTFNVYSQIGLITLVGLITKHGILIVEFANQMRQQGMALAKATRTAAVQRLRPILMTTAAMVLGALPLALASGAGAESRRQIGWVIVGGMGLGTLLTLLLVPTVYLLLARRRVPGARA